MKLIHFSFMKLKQENVENVLQVSRQKENPLSRCLTSQTDKLYLVLDY